MIALCGSVVWLGSSACAGSAKESWCGLVGKNSINRPEFQFVENDARLPNVLIYGDSISIGYTPRVRMRLAGKANVYRIHCNGGDSGTFIDKMTEMHRVMCDPSLDGGWDFEWDLIHFNVGLHDLKYVVGNRLDKKDGAQVSSSEVYEKNLRDILAYLTERAPSATLVFATTTPVPEGEPGRIAGDAAVYNAVALNVLKEFPRVVINDLFQFTRPSQSAWRVGPGNVHYNVEGKNAQGDEVARVIRLALDQKNH